MKKFILFFLSACFIYISCKKESSPADPVVPQPPSSGLININDPDEVSAALKIFHGEKLNGQVPVNHSSSSSLDPSTNGREYHAVAG